MIFCLERMCEQLPKVLVKGSKNIERAVINKKRDDNGGIVPEYKILSDMSETGQRTL